MAPQNSNIKSEFRMNDEEKKKYDSLKIPPSLFIACSSNALQKRYPYPYLREAVDKLRKDFSIVVLGQDCDRSFYQDILSLPGIVDLVGKTKLYEIFYLLKKYARMILCVDSSILHMASYINIPIVGLFGQNSPVRYGPWSDRFIVLLNSNLCCVPCEKPHCKFDHKCMEIEPKAVVDAVKQLTEAK
jgi:ADP-heptose:LPS heptosyltransferase